MAMGRVGRARRGKECEASPPSYPMDGDSARLDRPACASVDRVRNLLPHDQNRCPRFGPFFVGLRPPRPASAIKIVCSNCADRPPSLVLTVQPSRLFCTVSLVPVLIIGSMVKQIPGSMRWRGDFGGAWCGGAGGGGG